jgi:hypothetical protein
MLAAVRSERRRDELSQITTSVRMSYELELTIFRVAEYQDAIGVRIAGR